MQSAVVDQFGCLSAANLHTHRITIVNNSSIDVRTCVSVLMSVCVQLTTLQLVITVRTNFDISCTIQTVCWNTAQTRGDILPVKRKLATLPICSTMKLYYIHCINLLPVHFQWSTEHEQRLKTKARTKNFEARFRTITINVMIEVSFVFKGIKLQQLKPGSQS